MQMPKRIPQFDHLRGVAVFMVMLFHACHHVQAFPMARYISVGWTGVDLFFVLSGFLVTGTLVDTRDQRDTSRILMRGAFCASGRSISRFPARGSWRSAFSPIKLNRAGWEGCWEVPALRVLNESAPAGAMFSDDPPLYSAGPLGVEGAMRRKS